MRIEPISFKRGTSRISELSQSELDALVVRFNSWPNYYLRVVGHSLNKGDLNANRKLALQRAKATVNYLVNKGVSENRLQFEVAESNDSSASTSFILGQKPY